MYGLFNLNRPYLAFMIQKCIAEVNLDYGMFVNSMAQLSRIYDNFIFVSMFTLVKEPDWQLFLC